MQESLGDRDEIRLGRADGREMAGEDMAAIGEDQESPLSAVTLTPAPSDSARRCGSLIEGPG